MYETALMLLPKNHKLSEAPNIYYALLWKYDLIALGKKFIILFLLVIIIYTFYVQPRSELGLSFSS